MIIITVIVYCNLFPTSGEVWRENERFTRDRNVSRRSVAAFVDEIDMRSDECEKEKKLEVRRDQGDFLE
jgi:hypothetical protein